MLQAQLGPAGDQGRQVARVVRRARAAAEEHDRVVEHAAVAVLVLGETAEEMRQICSAEEQVVFRERQLPVLVRRVREASDGSLVRPSLSGNVSLIPMPSSRLSMNATDRVMSASKARAIRSNMLR